MSSEPKASQAESELLAAVRAAARQEQFLEVVSAEEAKRRFERHLDLTPLPGERVMLAAALGRVEPVASGYLSLQTLIKAEGWVLIPADSEGHPEGARVIVRPWP